MEVSRILVTQKFTILETATVPFYMYCYGLSNRIYNSEVFSIKIVSLYLQRIGKKGAVSSAVDFIVSVR
jgi:hypothetical protein